MNIQIMKLISLAIMFFSWSTTQAQQQDQKFAQAMKQNSVALREYTWTSRSEIRKEGDLKGTKLFMNRYAPDGTVVQIMLDETSASIPKFGIRGASPSNHLARRRQADSSGCETAYGRTCAVR